MNGETFHPGMGIHSQQFPDGSWGHMVTDALGSVREVMDENLNSLEAVKPLPRVRYPFMVVVR